MVRIWSSNDTDTMLMLDDVDAWRCWCSHTHPVNCETKVRTLKVSEPRNSNENHDNGAPRQTNKLSLFQSIVDDDGIVKAKDSTRCRGESLEKVRDFVRITAMLCGWWYFDILSSIVVRATVNFPSKTKTNNSQHPGNVKIENWRKTPKNIENRYDGWSRKWSENDFHPLWPTRHSILVFTTETNVDFDFSISLKIEK